MGKRTIIRIKEVGNLSTQPSGIIIPDTVKGNLNQGEVLAIGNCEQYWGPYDLF